MTSAPQDASPKSPTEKPVELSEDEKKNWICEQYNGSWELWVDPAALYDALHRPTQISTCDAAIERAADSLFRSLKAASSLLIPEKGNKNAMHHIQCAARDCLHAAFDAQASSERESSEPTEAMCKRARGFIMGLDLNIRKWASMSNHLRNGGYPTLPYIEEQAKKNPIGHITKWDVADCIYRLMTTQIEGEATS